MTSSFLQNITEYIMNGSHCFCVDVRGTDFDCNDLAHLDKSDEKNC